MTGVIVGLIGAIIVSIRIGISIVRWDDPEEMVYKPRHSMAAGLSRWELNRRTAEVLKEDLRRSHGRRSTH